jgi:hypothetical protein
MLALAYKGCAHVVRLLRCQHHGDRTVVAAELRQII